MAEAVPLVTERPSGVSLKLGQSARRVFDITGVTNAVDAAEQLYLQKSVREGSPHDHDGRLRVPLGGINIDGAKGGRNWVATVEYQAPPGFTIVDNPDLLDQKWRISVDPEESEEPIDKDRYGAILNSSGQPFDSETTRPFQSVTITMWRYESTYPLSKHLQYANRFNSDSVTLPKIGIAAAGELLLKSIKPAEEVDADAEIVKVVYTLRARPRITVGNDVYHGFHRRRLDIGSEAWGSDGKLHPIVYKESPYTNQVVTQPVRLNGKGTIFDTATYMLGIPTPADAPSNKLPPQPIETTAYAAFLLLDTTDGPIAFSGLNIGANL